MAALFKYCPRCGEESFNFQNENHLVCRECDFQLYRNAATAVGALILNEKDELLLTIRSKEPAKGKCGLPGGFVDYRESAEAALKREIREEISIEVDTFEYLCSHPNTYLFKEVTYYTVDFFFTARIAKPAEVKFDEEEIAGIKWVPVEGIDLKSMAFDSMRFAIERLKRK